MEKTKILSYHVRMNPDNSGTLVVDDGEKETELSVLYNVGHLTAAQVDERAKLELQANDVEVVDDPRDLVVLEPEMTAQKKDLAFVRKSMKRILADLANKSISLGEKKNNLAVYSQMCQAAQVMTNACKMEIQIEALSKIK